MLNISKKKPNRGGPWLAHLGRTTALLHCKPARVLDRADVNRPLPSAFESAPEVGPPGTGATLRAFVHAMDGRAAYYASLTAPHESARNRWGTTTTPAQRRYDLSPILWNLPHSCPPPNPKTSLIDPSLSISSKLVRLPLYPEAVTSQTVIASPYWRSPRRRGRPLTLETFRSPVSSFFGADLIPR